VPAWLREILAWLGGVLLLREVTLANAQEKRRADDAEAALALDQKADQAGAAYDALSDADKLRYREKYGVYRDE
jgi:hypothetical protein